MAEFNFTEILPTTSSNPEFRFITTDGITTSTLNGKTFLNIEPKVLEQIAFEAIHDISHYLRSDHLTQLRRIIDDPVASPNDRFVALDLLKNANISAGGVLPMCQDTGTAIVSAKRGTQILIDGDDTKYLAKGIFDAYQKLNLRYSQMSPVNMWKKKTQVIIYLRKLRFIRIRNLGMKTNMNFYLWQKVEVAQIKAFYIKKLKRFLMK